MGAHMVKSGVETVTAGAAAFHAALSPFISLTVAKTKDVASADQLDRCLTDIEAICAAEEQPATSSFTRLPEQRPGGVRLRAMWYKRTLTPAWTSDSSFVDVQHPLADPLLTKAHPPPPPTHP